MDRKVSILSLIREEKNVLFGRFSHNLTHDNKVAAWKDVTEKAKALGIYDKDKDWKCMRDTTWQNWKKRTLEKRDNRKRTGSKGGKSCIFDEGDKIIFEIIGLDSPNLDGLLAPESSGTSSQEIFTTVEETKENIAPTPLKQIPKSKRKVGDSNEDMALTSLKKKRLEHQNELLKLQVQYKKRELHKMNLDIYNLEQQLSLPLSHESRQLLIEHLEIEDSFQEHDTGVLFLNVDSD